MIVKYLLHTAEGEIRSLARIAKYYNYYNRGKIHIHEMKLLTIVIVCILQVILRYNLQSIMSMMSSEVFCIYLPSPVGPTPSRSTIFNLLI